MKPLLCSCFDTSTEQSTIILNDFFCLNKDIDHYNFRSSSNFHKFQARTNYQKHLLKYIGVSIWNNLTKSIKEIKKCNLFKKTIKPNYHAQTGKFEFHETNVRDTQRQFLENICSEDDFRSRIFGTFVVRFLACLPLLGFSNI